MTYRILILLLFISIAEAKGLVNDSTPGSWGIEVKAEYGFVMAHRPAVLPLQQEHVRGLELTFLKPTTGKKFWEDKFLHPDVGITIAAFDLGSPDYLGKGIAVYPFINFPLHRTADWNLYFRYGMGLGWIEKIFNVENRIKNGAIGSHLNGVLHLNFHTEKKLNEHSFISAGIGLTHYSNGSTAMPNLGINIPTAHLGFMHYFGNPAAHVPPVETDVTKKGRIEFYIAGAFKKIYPPLGKVYPAGTLSIARMQAISARSDWGAGVDIFYDESILEKLTRDNQLSATSADNFRPGIYGAYQVAAGNLGLMFNMGFYPYSKWKGDGNFYHRICFRYYIHNFIVCMNLKTHYAKADFIEWGLGWRFGKR